MHIDTWGPYPIIGINNIKGFEALIDDVCRFIWTKTYQRQEQIINISIDILRSIATVHNFQVRRHRMDNAFVTDRVE